MRRADRLFQIIQQLKNRRLTTAQLLSEVLEVSTRTIYRDIQDLIVSGIPIEGEAGVGYMLRKEVDVPPLMFSETELEAIQVGMRMVQAWGGHELSKAAKQAMIKVSAVLPERLQSFNALMFAPNFYDQAPEFQHIDTLRNAARTKQVLRFDYLDANQNPTLRQVRPLAIYLWKAKWTVLTWCELREDFRSFRIDRIQTVTYIGKSFEPQVGQRLEDFLEQIYREYDVTPDNSTI